MNRFYLPPQEFAKDEATLPPGELHHARNVLRLAPGDKITVFNGEGAEAPATLGEGGTVRIGERTKTPPLRCAVTLAQAIPKGKNMDLIIQKAVEIGAAAVAPLTSDRTVVRLGPEELEAKREKWQAAAIEACKQCGQNWLPKILRPTGVKEFLGGGKLPELPLVASLQPGSRHIKAVLAEVCAELGRLPASAAILVGPEGDFTPAETAMARSAGYRPVTLGPIILRTETAAIYSLSVLAHELF